MIFQCVPGPQKIAAFKKIVAEVDMFRFAFVRKLFSEMGFKGSELAIRSEIFVRDAGADSLYCVDHKLTKQNARKQILFYTRK